MRDRVRSLVRRLVGEEAFIAIRAAWWRWKLRRSDYEPETRALALLVPPGGVAIDCGGNFGQYAYYLSRIAAEVHSFEPLAYNRRVFERVIRASNVHLHPFALTAKRETLRIEVTALNTGEAHVAQHGDAVEAIPLDDFGASLTRLDFIKIDVEGFEVEVLRGAAKLIERFRPAILCEIGDHARRYAHTADEAFEILRQHGYRANVWRGAALQPVDGLTDGAYNYIFVAS
jgi:FkbM family methyltransferase